MPIVLGPDSGTLTVRTRRRGAASKAGHDLRMEVGSWSAQLDLNEPASLSLSADSRSFRVVEGTGGGIPLGERGGGAGGVTRLGDEEREAIPKTIDEDVLKGQPIEFRSTDVAVAGERIDVRGELDLFGAARPVAFTLERDGNGRITGAATVKHSDWGVKPYTALFGTLKVADEVEIAVDAIARSTDDG